MSSSSVVEDWLSDEKFDFDVSPSPVNGDDCLLMDEKELEDDDEEVFFGPQTFKEKVVATVLNEKEAIQQPLEKLNPEEQALLLRESALLSLMIKHGTPKSSRSSPVAVVHPMKRDNRNEELQEIMLKKNSMKEGNDKENCVIKSKTSEGSKVKASGILQPKFTSGKQRVVSEPSDVGTSTRLPVSKTRGKIHSEFSETVIDPAVLYGLSGQSTNKPTRRRSGLPVKQVSEGVHSKVKSAKPSLLPSAIPSTRTKVSSVSRVDSKLKPVRATTLSGSTVPQSQLKVPTSRKSINISQGTPSKSSKRTQNASSLRHQNSRELKHSNTPGGNVLPRASESQKKSTNLVTPVQRTPSTRKSITGRQLLHHKVEENAWTVESSAQNTIVEKVEDIVNQKSADNNADANPASTDVIDGSNTSSLPSHADIMNRYKKLKEKQNSASIDGHYDKKSLHSIELRRDGESECKVVTSPVDETESEPIESEEKCPIGESCVEDTLLELSSPLLQLSPVKKDQMLDPFQTGATPPPLIDIGDVLQPERPTQTDLIQF